MAGVSDRLVDPFRYQTSLTSRYEQMGREGGRERRCRRKTKEPRAFPHKHRLQPGRILRSQWLFINLVNIGPFPLIYGTSPSGCGIANGSSWIWALEISFYLRVLQPILPHFPGRNAENGHLSFGQKITPLGGLCEPSHHGKLSIRISLSISV